MSTKQLNFLAREKKKQADSEKRTFEDVKQSMSLYLESVCYFIQCAHDEPIVKQRTSLLAATLSMLQLVPLYYYKNFYLNVSFFYLDILYIIMRKCLTYLQFNQPKH